MCLCATKQTLTAAKKTRKSSGKVYAWKVVKLQHPGNIMSLFYHSFSWKPGWNLSNREDVVPTDGELRRSALVCSDNIFINRGIHVYLVKQHALRACYECCGQVVIRVECYNKHLVARNHKSTFTSKKAVYTKVFLPKKEYDRVTKGK